MSIVVSADSRHVYTTGWVGGVSEFSGVTAVTHFRAGADGALSFADCIGNEPSGCTEFPYGTYGLHAAHGSRSRWLEASCRWE